jgi:lauroyl/myristoyl acyltransferase
MLINSLAMSRIGPALGMGLARLLPRKAAYGLVNLAVQRMVADPKNSAMIKAIRSNHAVVRGLEYNDPTLKNAAHLVLRNAGCGLTDLFHAMQSSDDQLSKNCIIDSQFIGGIENSIKSNRGLIIVGPHSLGFDMVLLRLGSIGYPVQALSYASPGGSYKAQNRMRAKYGLILTPISVQSLREAFSVLRLGGWC